jgi:hypothetical protein
MAGSDRGLNGGLGMSQFAIWLTGLVTGLNIGIGLAELIWR